MPKVYKRDCDFCGEYYEGYGKRFCCHKCSTADQRENAAAEPTDDPAQDLRDYQYRDGTYFWVVNDKLYTVEYERWDAICRDYSEHGSDMTQAEVARKHGIPHPILKRLLRSYGQYKASPPNCRERIHEHRGDFTPLIDEALENDEHRFLSDLERKRDTEWRKEYRDLKSREVQRQRVLDAARDIAASLPPISVDGFPNIVDATGSPWVGHAPTADEHAGKYVWDKESFGENFTADEAASRIREHAECTAAWIASQPGPCKTIYRTLLGDLFHALMGETEHGTKLDQDTRAARVWTITLHALLHSLTVLSKSADRVVVKGAPGNHDGFLFYVAMDALAAKAKAEGLDNVSVEPRPGYFDHFRVGESLHVMDHGYRVGSLSGWKAKAQAELVAREVGAEDYHGCEQIYTYVGHLHEHNVGSHGAHLKIIRLPSLAESDDYETGLRYSSQPAAHLFRLDGRGRIRDERVLLRGDLGRLDDAA